MSTPTDSLTQDQVRAMLLKVAENIITAEPELSEADRVLGDGDHGLGMQRGMEAAKVALAEAPADATVADLFSGMGNAMMGSMGGASGIVFGSLFRAGKKTLADSPESFTSPGLAALLKSAHETVTKRGGAKPGDKTMLDALVPAAEAAEKATSLPVSEALDQVATAAEKGRDASADLIATMGRAKTLGEKSIGHPDPGACSVAIILRTMANCASS